MVSKDLMSGRVTMEVMVTRVYNYSIIVSNLLTNIFLKFIKNEHVRHKNFLKIIFVYFFY
jgi:hypothetical protein